MRVPSLGTEQTLKPIYSIHIGRRAYCIHMLQSLSGVSNGDTINNTDDVYRHISLQSFSSCNNFWPRLTTPSIRISTSLGKHFVTDYNLACIDYCLDLLFGDKIPNTHCSLLKGQRAFSPRQSDTQLVGWSVDHLTAVNHQVSL